VSNRSLYWLALPVAGIALSGCAGGGPKYPDLPTINPSDSFHDRTLVVQKWAKDSCFYNPAGVADLAGVSAFDATYGQMEDALEQWFEEHDPDATTNVPAGASYYVAVTTGCAMGLDKANN
jgi:hypothetical protein